MATFRLSTLQPSLEKKRKTKKIFYSDLIFMFPELYYFRKEFIKEK